MPDTCEYMEINWCLIPVNTPVNIWEEIDDTESKLTIKTMDIQQLSISFEKNNFKQ